MDRLDSNGHVNGQRRSWVPSWLRGIGGSDPSGMRMLTASSPRRYADVLADRDATTPVTSERPSATEHRRSASIHLAPAPATPRTPQPTIGRVIARTALLAEHAMRRGGR